MSIERLLKAVEALKSSYPPPPERGVYSCQTGLFDLYEAARAVAPAQDAWWKILADNWRGRNGNTTTGDSVRNSCADELEKVAARHSPAVQERLAAPGSPERTAELQYEAGMYESLYLAWKERAERAEAQVESARSILDAARLWRESLEGDGWDKNAIESGICRPGISELMRAVDSLPHTSTERRAGD